MLLEGYLSVKAMADRAVKWSVGEWGWNAMCVDQALHVYWIAWKIEDKHRNKNSMNLKSIKEYKT